MATIKQLVCLANSRKHRERCVAGIEIGSHNWIRPVSSRAGHAISASERQYESAEEPQVLDIISMRLIEHQPVGFQRENWLLDSTVHWRKEGQIGWGKLCLLEQGTTRLWINDYDTSSGKNDRVPADQQNTVLDSLKLIRVDSVTIRVNPPHPMSPDTRPTVRAEFQLAGSTYILKVTDPMYEKKYRSKGIGSYRLGDSFLTVSLSEEFEGYLYKLVAAIVERAEVESGGRT